MKKILIPITVLMCAAWTQNDDNVTGQMFELQKRIQKYCQDTATYQGNTSLWNETKCEKDTIQKMLEGYPNYQGADLFLNFYDNLLSINELYDKEQITSQQQSNLSGAAIDSFSKSLSERSGTLSSNNSGHVICNTINRGDIMTTDCQ